MTTDKDTEIRHMDSTLRDQLCRLLRDELSLFMGSIHRDLEDPHSPLRFPSDQVDLIREKAERERKNPIETLFGEWGTMGVSRPRLSHLLALLIKCQLFRAADYLAKELGEPLPLRPIVGPAASVNTALADDLEGRLNAMEYPYSSNAGNRDSNKAKPENKNIAVAGPSSLVENAELPLINYQPGPSRTQSSRTINQSTNLIQFSKSKIANGIPSQESTKTLTNSKLPPSSSELQLPDFNQLGTSQRYLQENGSAVLPAGLNSVEEGSESFSRRTNGSVSQMSSETISGSLVTENHDEVYVEASNTGYNMPDLSAMTSSKSQSQEQPHNSTDEGISDENTKK